VSTSLVNIPFWCLNAPKNPLGSGLSQLWEAEELDPDPIQVKAESFDCKNKNIWEENLNKETSVMDNKIDPINDNKKEPFEEKFIKQLLL